MDIILIPGLWLDGSSWEEVVPILEGAGHRPHPITLPGMDSAGADRSGISLPDHVAAVVAVIDSCDSTRGPVTLVGHSAGGGLAHAAADARPDRVARVLYVGGFPTPDGEPIAGPFPTRLADIPLPEWEAFDEADLAGLDEAARATFRRSAIPSPANLTTARQDLTDDRRYDIPVTVICTEFTSEALVGWIEQGLVPVGEFGRMRHVEFVDLPTGHWPQFTRPADLGRVIVERAYVPHLDEHGRIHPPPGAGEATTVLGYLDYHRATLEWKCRALAAAELNATVAASALTLGGLLKHMAWVEEHWFSYRLHAREPAPPWATVDWKADPDWEFTSSAHDPPAALKDLWRSAVARSGALVAAAMAEGGLDRLAARPAPDGEKVSLRWILLHMIEEYARHNGHADLLRESIDGQTGE